MVIKVYVSGISSSPEIRSYQQRSQFILDSLRVEYDSVDITDVGNEELKDMIKEKCKHRNGQPPKTPQFFNDEIYCGDWFDFEIASDEDRVLEWLGLEDTRVEPEDQPEAVKEQIEGMNETNNTENEEQTIKTEIKDGIVTTETITKEEQIIFSKQNVKTAPISVRLDESGKEVIEFKDENRVIEEEDVLLENKVEIIKSEEEVVNRVIQNKKADEEDDKDEVENLENGDENYANGDLNNDDNVQETDQEKDEENEKIESEDENKNESAEEPDESMEE